MQVKHKPIKNIFEFVNRVSETNGLKAELVTLESSSLVAGLYHRLNRYMVNSGIPLDNMIPSVIFNRKGKPSFIFSINNIGDYESFKTTIQNYALDGLRVKLLENNAKNTVTVKF